MSEVTCSLCIIKIDELKWKEHLISTNHLELYKNGKDKNARQIFELILNPCPKISKIYDLKIDFWLLHFSTKLPIKNLISYAAIQSIIQI